MNGIENIIRRIERDAQSRAENIAAEAAREAEEIRAEASKKAAEEAAEIISKGKADAGERKLRLGGVSELEARKTLLAEKQKMIDLAFENAKAKLLALPAEKYAELLASLATSAAEGASGEIILSEKDRSEVGAVLLEKLGKDNALTISRETREIGGGLVLRSGATEVNCSFDAIIKGLRETMASEIAAVLFK